MPVAVWRNSVTIPSLRVCLGWHRSFQIVSGQPMTAIVAVPLGASPPHPPTVYPTGFFSVGFSSRQVSGNPSLKGALRRADGGLTASAPKSAETDTFLFGRPLTAPVHRFPRSRDSAMHWVFFLLQCLLGNRTLKTIAKPRSLGNRGFARGSRVAVALLSLMERITTQPPACAPGGIGWRWVQLQPVPPTPGRTPLGVQRVARVRRITSPPM